MPSRSSSSSTNANGFPLQTLNHRTSISGVSMPRLSVDANAGPSSAPMTPSRTGSRASRKGKQRLSDGGLPDDLEESAALLGRDAGNGLGDYADPEPMVCRTYLLPYRASLPCSGSGCFLVQQRRVRSPTKDQGQITKHSSSTIM